MKPSFQKVAFRHILAYDASEMSRAELKQMVDFLTTQVSTMDDASVCYGMYCCSGVIEQDQTLIKPLFTALARRYRLLLLDWFKFALVKRSNVGGGGSGIKRLEEALATWIESIPDTLTGKPPVSLVALLGDQDYLDSQKLAAVAQKVLFAINQEYKAQFLTRTAKVNLPNWNLRFDKENGVWFIDSQSTYEYRNALGGTGMRFRWAPERKRWETKTLTQDMKDAFHVIGLFKAPPAAPILPVNPSRSGSAVHDWFFGTWLPKNIDRFSKVFTDYARNSQSSYKFLFTLAGTKIDVTFKRQITNMADAIEELRYRYIGRQGRESWLEVLDKVIELIQTQEPNRILHIIDRVNNLQHSNGLFMEHFPKGVQSWYLKFLNAKYSAPTSSHLARFIPDRDLRDLFSWLGTLVRQTYVSDARFTEPRIDESQLKPVELGDVNWRAKGYPAQPGYKQVDRFDPQVQRGLRDIPRQS